MRNFTRNSQCHQRFLSITVLDYVLRISLDSVYEKGLLIHPRRSRRHPSVYVTYLDFADDLAITSDTVQNAEERLHAVEEAAAHAGLLCDTTKTESISSSNDATVKSLLETYLNVLTTSSILALTSCVRKTLGDENASLECLQQA